LCAKLVIYKDCNKMRGQQNIKTVSFALLLISSRITQKRNSNLIGENCNVNVVEDDNKNDNDS